MQVLLIKLQCVTIGALLQQLCPIVERYYRHRYIQGDISNYDG